MLVDEPELCARLTKPASALVLVGSLDGALLMTPQQQPNTCLVELSAAGAGVQPRCWLNYEQGIEHMRAFILKQQDPGCPEAVGEDEIAAWDAQSLVARYVMMKRARASFRARTQKPCFASS
mmetsp:Transcript_1961/g.3032  ORF Transcript_1961/g.3032 Transcript_1961/m.3032 type:complete len:122 (-) Transcript_1961:47-412(-)